MKVLFSYNTGDYVVPDGIDMEFAMLEPYMFDNSGFLGIVHRLALAGF